MIDFKTIDHIHICCPPERLQEAFKFYTEVLGLQKTYRPDVFGAPGHWFKIGGIELHIGIEAQQPRTIRHSAFEVQNLSAARVWLESCGVKVHDEPLIEGRRRFMFYDPLGNRMELLEYDKDGSAK
jgi:catechol 2,3-dioxygenase-like lactoylglutathione lyase family enzyme